MTYSTFDEYTALLADTARISDRRQTVNNLLIGLNGLMLAGLFYPLVNFKLDNYVPVAMSGVVTVAAIFINQAWFRLNNRYRLLVNIRITYMKELEMRLQAETHHSQMGILHREAEMYKKGEKIGFSAIEREFIFVLTFIYPIATLAVAGVVTAVTQYGLSLPTLTK